MAKRKVYETFVDLPQGVQDFFMREVDNVYDPLIKDFKLPEDQFFKLIEDPILQTVFNYRTLEKALADIKINLTALKISDEDQAKIVERLLQGVFWPLRGFFADELTAYLSANKIDTRAWSLTQVLFKPVSFSGAASEVINRLALYSLGKQARVRLRDLIAKFSKGEILPDQLKEAMMRLPDFGGLGFDDKTASRAVSIITELGSSVKFISEEDYSDLLAEESKRSTLKSPEHEEDANEIATIKAGMPAPPKVVTELDKAVDATWEKIENKPNDAYLARRLKNIISSRLRDVRSSNELLGLLQRDVKVGGMGLDREQSSALAAQIEKAYKEYRGSIEAEEKQKMEQQMIEQKRKIEERRKQEAEAHAKWYAEKIKSREVAEESKKKLAEALKKEMITQLHPVDIKSQAEEEKRFGEMVAIKEPVKAPTKSVDKEVPAVIAPEKTRTVRVSATTAVMAESELSKNRVDGVRAAPKLQSLVGELGNLTLTQFRRLGKTPLEATQKIIQRIETLEKESFEQKVSGIRAWQTSPVMKAYLVLVSESFKTGRPIAQVAEDERSKNKDTLTRDEIEALIQLNNQLHF